MKISSAFPLRGAGTPARPSAGDRPPGFGAPAGTPGREAGAAARGAVFAWGLPELGLRNMFMDDLYLTPSR